MERLTNPSPLTLPGFVNSQVRVTNIVPIYPGNLAGNGLELALTLEVTGEALVQNTAEAGAASIALGPQRLSLTLSGVTGAGAVNFPNSLPLPRIPAPGVPVPHDRTPR